MKNAMKKLTSLLLVAVLLVGALPFGASASEYDPTAFLGTSTHVANNAAEPAAEPAPIGNLDSNEPVALGQVNDPAVFSLVIDACASAETKYGFKSASVEKYSCDAGIRPGQVIRDYLKMDRATWDKMVTEFDVKFNSSDDVTVNTNLVMVTISEREPEPVDPVKVTLRFADSSQHYDKMLAPGTELNLDPANANAILTLFEATLPQGQQISFFKENNQPVTKLTVAEAVEILAVTMPISNGDTTGGTTTGGTTTGGNLSGGTTTGGTSVANGTVVFRNYNNGTLYTANLYNGKLTATDVNNATNAATREGYTFNGWLINGAGTAAASDLLLNMTFSNGDYLVPSYTAKTTSSTITSTKNMNDIFLNIFVNKDFQNCKTIKLNDHWVISDDKVTKDEILQYVVTDYYSAYNTNLGLQADKLYYSVGSFMYNWLTDNGTLTIENISAKRAQGTVTINIMVTNAVAKTSTAAADTSNPKTGDNIYTAMTVMGLSAASLAAVMFFYNKKRYTV